MNNSLKDILKKAKTVTLTDAEKEQGRRALRIYMEEYPAEAQKIGAAGNGSFSSGILPLLARFSTGRFFTPSFAVAICILVVTTGITFAAQSSLPGDALYPVKVQLTEPLGGVLTFSKVAKVQRESDLAERRLDEAQQLLIENRLDDTRKQVLEKSFNDHMNRAADDLQELANEDNDRAADVINVKVTEKLRKRRDDFSQSSTQPLPALAAPTPSSTNEVVHPADLSLPIVSEKSDGHGGDDDFVIPVNPAIEKLEDLQESSRKKKMLKDEVSKKSEKQNDRAKENGKGHD